MDLKTTYIGLELTSPLVVSACPISSRIDNLRRMEEAGAAAVVLWSLFEEQVEHDASQLEFYLQYGTERFAESLTYFPKPKEYRTGPQQYLDYIRQAKQAVKIPIIASLNGLSTGGWISYAKMAQEAGADGVELNVYYIPTDPRLGSEDVENVYLAVLEAVKASVNIPVAMKLSPFFSSLPNMVQRLDKSGVDALVLFNRFYQPDIDVKQLRTVPSLTLSTSWEMRLPLRWVALLYGRLHANLAASTGIYTGEDVAKMILAGADVTMMCSAILRDGVEALSKAKAQLVRIMQEMEYESVAQMRGVLSHARTAEPAAFERANYMKVLQSYGPTMTLE